MDWGSGVCSSVLVPARRLGGYVAVGDVLQHLVRLALGGGTVAAGAGYVEDDARTRRCRERALAQRLSARAIRQFDRETRRRARPAAGQTEGRGDGAFAAEGGDGKGVVWGPS